MNLTVLTYNMLFAGRHGTEIAARRRRSACSMN